MKIVGEESWKVKEVFNVLDKDGDWKIGLSDLQHFFAGSRFRPGKDLSREQMEGMISVADAHNNDFLNFEEFQRILRLIMPEIYEINECRSNTDLAQMWALKEAFNVMGGDEDETVNEVLKIFFFSDAYSSSYYTFLDSGITPISGSNSIDLLLLLRTNNESSHNE